jgi:hypothetical protein
VSLDYLANLRKLKKKFELWAGVMKRGGTHKLKAQSRGTGEKKGCDTLY